MIVDESGIFRCQMVLRYYIHISDMAFLRRFIMFRKNVYSDIFGIH